VRLSKRRQSFSFVRPCTLAPIISIFRFPPRSLGVQCCSAPLTNRAPCCLGFFSNPFTRSWDTDRFGNLCFLASALLIACCNPLSFSPRTFLRIPPLTSGPLVLLYPPGNLFCLLYVTPRVPTPLRTKALSAVRDTNSSPRAVP